MDGLVVDIAGPLVISVNGTRVTYQVVEQTPPHILAGVLGITLGQTNALRTHLATHSLDPRWPREADPSTPNQGAK